MRIGLLYPTRVPTSASNWSGTPQGLAGGLARAGVEVVGIGTGISLARRAAESAERRIVTERHAAVVARTPRRRAIRTRDLRRSLERALPLDGVLAMGTELYDLASVVPNGLRAVTYDDGTLEQMWRNVDSDIRKAGFPDKDVPEWFRQQAASSRAAWACCVSTTWAARSFIDDYGVSSDRLRVVGMGHRPRAGDLTSPRDWTVPRFLFVGVDWQRKNGDAVVRAFGEVRRLHPAATLDVVGRHPALDAPGITGHGFLPREDERAQVLLDRLFAHATAFVLPSRFDPSPIAYLEAASAGIPVIATSEGGAGELLGDAAITVHPDDDGALVAALVRLADPEVAKAMGAEALRRSAASSWEHVAGRVLEALTLGANHSDLQ